MKTIDYKIIAKTSFMSLEEEVRNYLESGWELHGDLIFESLKDGSCIRIQAMKKVIRDGYR